MNIIIFIINLLNLKHSVRLIYFSNVLQINVAFHESSPNQFIVKHLDARK